MVLACSVVMVGSSSAVESVVVNGDAITDSLLDGETRCYRVLGLQPNGHAEARVSYVGATPARFQLSFECLNHETHGLPHGERSQPQQPLQHKEEHGARREHEEHQEHERRKRRELLDTSKIVFETDAEAQPVGPWQKKDKAVQGSLDACCA